jgi:phenylalanyl-tRNA synthetase beta chain
MEVKIKESPNFIKERLETSDIRSLNNLIDVTNYVMRTVGHPAHVFDFDRLSLEVLTIREAKRGEKIKTLDGKTHILFGEEIIAENNKKEIVDLLGIMGLENSVVTNNTKRILYFIDNNEKSHIRKASMSLGIRSEAAVLNEKGLDPEMAMEALLYGVKLYEQIAEGKIISNIIDIYPNKPESKNVGVSEKKITSIIGVEIPIKKASAILSGLGFENKISSGCLTTTIPSFRTDDVEKEEDLIEEIARIYGYHNLPSVLPSIQFPLKANSNLNEFFWEERLKEALKYWGFIECYTYSFVSEKLLEGPGKDAIEIQNPLTEDFVYMRKTLVPSLLEVISANKNRDEIKIFEMAKVYFKKPNDLPDEVTFLSGVYKKNNLSFYEVKGLIEQLLFDLGIKNLTFKNSEKGGLGTSLYINKDHLGEIEVLENNLIDFELNFSMFLKFANLNKEYKIINKYPPVIEDISVIVSDEIKTEDLIAAIKKQNVLIDEVTLIDTFENSRTFRIVYQDIENNLTNKDIIPIREKINSFLKDNYSATIK